MQIENSFVFSTYSFKCSESIGINCKWNGVGVYIYKIGRRATCGVSMRMCIYMCVCLYDKEYGLMRTDAYELFIFNKPIHENL